MKKSPLLSFIFLFIVHSAFAQQSPEEFLDYQLGTNFTRHHRVVEYFRHVADNSPNVQYQTYGETYEGRPLGYAVVSSEENLNNLEQIRKDHLQNAGLLKGANNASAEKAIVWLSYNVHGNEASSTEAAMKTLYELITNRQDWLKNVVVIMDPTMNPDGRDRYVNWYRQVKANPSNSNPMAVEHHEPWPGGRPNHYLFDLNRDWAWATQTETRQRLKIYNQWLPHIHVDFHEQRKNEPYYFAPAAAPLHEAITPFQREFQTEIGKNHAKYFDKEGWLYFTKEVFDLLYPSYGDTYPTYMGAIGMTYEQAGHAGLSIQTDEGYDLTLVDRVAHHTTTGLSTVEVAAQNVDRLTSEFAKFYQEKDRENTNYVLTGDQDKLDLLKELLDRHEIEYAMAQKGKVKGYNARKKKNETMEVSGNSLVISTSQPKGTMVRVLMESSTKLPDSLTYDITAWSLPYAYGLESLTTNRKLPLTDQSSTPVANTAAPEAAAYLADWNSMKDARFLSALLANNIRVRFTETTMEHSGKSFEPGSLVITKGDNRNMENFNDTLIALADRFDQSLFATSTGFSSSGPDLGSSQVKTINAPKIGILRGEGTSSLNYGEIWYFFEQDLNYPVTSVDTGYFSNLDLSSFDVLILPTGNYNEVLDAQGLERLKTWVKAGGKVIAIGQAMKAFAGKENFALKAFEEKPKDSISKANLIPYAQREREDIKKMITGSIIETQLDNTHPMAFGYDDTYLSLKLNSDSYQLLDSGYNVGYLKEDPEVVAGFVGSEARKNLGNSLTFGVEPMGRGSFIYMTDNPLFRAFWQNGKLFFVNAIFFVDNSNIKN